MSDFCLIWALPAELVTAEPRFFSVPTLGTPCFKRQAPGPKRATLLPPVSDGEAGAYRALQREIQAALLAQLLLLRELGEDQQKAAIFSPPLQTSPKIPTGHVGFRVPVLCVPAPLETSIWVLLVWRPVISNQQAMGYCRQSRVETFLLLLGMLLWP